MIPVCSETVKVDPRPPEVENPELISDVEDRSKSSSEVLTANADDGV